MITRIEKDLAELGGQGLEMSQAELICKLEGKADIDYVDEVNDIASISQVSDLCTAPPLFSIDLCCCAVHRIVRL